MSSRLVNKLIATHKSTHHKSTHNCHCHNAKPKVTKANEQQQQQIGFEFIVFYPTKEYQSVWHAFPSPSISIDRSWLWMWRVSYHKILLNLIKTSLTNILFSYDFRVLLIAIFRRNILWSIKSEHTARQLIGGDKGTVVGKRSRHSYTTEVHL